MSFSYAFCLLNFIKATEFHFSRYYCCCYCCKMLCWILQHIEKTRNVNKKKKMIFMPQQKFTVIVSYCKSA